MADVHVACKCGTRTVIHPFISNLNCFHCDRLGLKSSQLEMSMYTLPPGHTLVVLVLMMDRGCLSGAARSSQIRYDNEVYRLEKR